jgi:hypothetical protein
VTRDNLKAIYARAKEEGSSLFSKERFQKFREGGGKKKAAAKKPAAKKKEPAPAAAPPRSKVARVIEVDFATRLAKHPMVVKAIGGKLHLDVTGEGGGQWTVDCGKKADWIQPGHQGSPKLTVRASAEDFLALISGAKNAQVAVLAGELVLDPMDLELAQELGRLFG